MDRKNGAYDDKCFIIKLYDEYYRFMYALVKASIYSKNEDDITACVNDVFIKALAKADALKNHGNVKAWLVLTAKYTVMNFNKKYIRERKKQVQLDEAHDNICGESFTESVHDEMDFGDMNIQGVKKAILDCLNSKEHELYSLKYEMNYDNPRIADKLGINENNVRARLSRLHKKIIEIKDSEIEKYVNGRKK